MTQARLIHCMLLAIYKEMAGKLNLIDVAANKLCFVSGERSRLYGPSCNDNLRFKYCIF